MIQLCLREIEALVLLAFTGKSLVGPEVVWRCCGGWHHYRRRLRDGDGRSGELWLGWLHCHSLGGWEILCSR